MRLLACIPLLTLLAPPLTTAYTHLVIPPSVNLNNTSSPNGTAPITPGTINTSKAPLSATFNYYGGPVISNVEVFVIFYGPTTRWQSQVMDYYRFITDSVHMDFLTEYNTPKQKIGRGKVIGSHVETRNLRTFLEDGKDIQTYLLSLVQAGIIQPTANTYYPMHFPLGTTISQQGDLSCVQFCGYHGTVDLARIGYTKTRYLYYGIMPDPGTGNCQYGCGQGTTFQNLCSVASHEIVEAVTDPGVGLATSYNFPLAWYHATHGEIGDICNAIQGQLTGPDGKVWTVQKEWSNVEQDCIITRNPKFATSPATATSTRSAMGTPVDDPNIIIIEFNSLESAMHLVRTNPKYQQAFLGMVYSNPRLQAAYLDLLDYMKANGYSSTGADLSGEASGETESERQERMLKDDGYKKRLDTFTGLLAEEGVIRHPDAPADLKGKKVEVPLKGKIGAAGTRKDEEEEKVVVQVVGHAKPKGLVTNLKTVKPLERWKRWVLGHLSFKGKPLAYHSAEEGRLPDIKTNQQPSPNDPQHKSIHPTIMFYAILKEILSILFKITVHVFFRDVTLRGTQNIPLDGPVIFVCAPHANQFIDSMMVWTKSQRQISFLAADVSMKRPLIGAVAKAMDSIAVVRPQDLARKGSGTVYLPEPDTDPYSVKGINTKFRTEVKVRDTLSLPNKMGNAEVGEVVSDTELRLAKPWVGDGALRCLTARKQVESVVATGRRKVVPEMTAEGGSGKVGRGSDEGEVDDGMVVGSSYKIMPYVDQSKFFDDVTDRLIGGNAVAIFPEGGSHDQTQLLPLKVGVSIIALTALSKKPSLNLKLVPVGLSYFHPHRFRSRAVVEYGGVIEVKPELVERFKMGGLDKRDAVNELMGVVRCALKAVTVECPDFQTLMSAEWIEAAKDIENNSVDNRDNPRVLALSEKLKTYHRLLDSIGIRDQEVETTGIPQASAVGLLVWNLVLMVLVFVFVIPGILLNAPIFLLSDYISTKKAKEALAASSVKVRGYDVLASWKVMISTLGFPILYLALAITTTILLTLLTPPPPAGPLTPGTSVAIGACVFFAMPFCSYFTIRITEHGKDLYLTLKPLAVSVFVSRSYTHGLRTFRKNLQSELLSVVDEIFQPAEPLLDEEGRSPVHKRRDTVKSFWSEYTDPGITEAEKDKFRSVGVGKKVGGDVIVEEEDLNGGVGETVGDSRQQMGMVGKGVILEEEDSNVAAGDMLSGPRLEEVRVDKNVEGS
ncbi:hypothetical protein HDV05_000477 [Chytridiales sp. JEL 0842]|nr:hypothetical protein HDV05_000477 [Chytridiales sp. JEL 0842]